MKIVGYITKSIDFSLLNELTDFVKLRMTKKEYLFKGM